MNPQTHSRDDLVSSISPALLGAGLVAALGLWLLCLFARQRRPGLSAAWLIAGIVPVIAAFWLGLQLLGNFLVLATSWPLAALALLGGAATQLVVALYGFEKDLVRPGRGRCLLGLRLAALAVLILILAQPVRSFLETREINREIAILIDDSDSMLLDEEQLDVSEKLDRAALAGTPAAARRPPLGRVRGEVSELAASIAEELEALATAPSPAAGLENRLPRLPDFFAAATASHEAITALLGETSRDGFPDEVASRVDEYRMFSRDGLPRILERAREASENEDAEALVHQLEAALTELRGITDTMASTAALADATFFGGLDGDARREIEESAAVSRFEVARRILENPLPHGAALPRETQEGAAGDPTLSRATPEASGEGPTLLDRLGERYNLRFYRFTRDIEPVAEPGELESAAKIGEDHRRSRTDLAAALDFVLNQTASEALAGVLLLSDGRHNGNDLPEDGLRQLAVQNTPLSAVPIGGRLGPVDISLLSLNAPESIYLDDRVIATAMVKADGLLGETIEAELVSNGEVVDRVSLEVSDVSFRDEIRLVHRPESRGIVDYQVRLLPDEREVFQNNNAWDFKVAVTDDRTNVLLVDSYPRWEFRYLRNLFYGRDKSVHLQSVLLNPDEIFRGRRPDSVAASATRPFGEAEATDLPRDASEWSLFDVIILGDIPPSALSPRDWEAIEESVTLRGALLVCIAGARHMPHGHADERLRRLLPITYEPGRSLQLETPESSYHIELTTSGQGHPVTMQSPSRSLNQDLWAGFQPMAWRYVPGAVKETAEVLAYARPSGAPALQESLDPDGSPGSIEAALEQLANQKTLERENALVVANRAGLGKVLMLNFDQTWRFRFGVGDTYHHRFWGQVVRWGAGENLRSGTERVRLGTDRLSYTTDDPIEVAARILDEDRRPVTDAEVEVEVWRGGVRISRQSLSYLSDSSGRYETTLASLGEEGDYELRLVGAEISRLLESEAESPGGVETELLVVNERNPVELAELTADRDFLTRATSLTGGRLAELDDLASLVTSFAAPKETLTERRNITLWDTWPLLAGFLGLLTAEWIIRRRSGLV